MKRLIAIAFLLTATVTAAAISPAVAGPRCGPHAHWVRGHWAGPYHHHWIPGHCV